MTNYFATLLSFIEKTKIKCNSKFYVCMRKCMKYFYLFIYMPKGYRNPRAENASQFRNTLLMFQVKFQVIFHLFHLYLLPPNMTVVKWSIKMSTKRLQDPGYDRSFPCFHELLVPTDMMIVYFVICKTCFFT